MTPSICFHCIHSYNLTVGYTIYYYYYYYYLLPLLKLLQTAAVYVYLHRALEYLFNLQTA